MDNLRQLSSDSIDTSITALPTDISTDIKKSCQTPTNAVRGFNGKTPWPSRCHNASSTTNVQKQPLVGLSCKGISLFLLIHVLFLAAFTAVIIYTRTSNSFGLDSAAGTPNGFSGLPQNMPKLLSTMRADMIPSLPLLTSSKVVSAVITLPAEYFRLDSDSAGIDGKTNTTNIDINSAVHRIYNVDAVEVKQGSDPAALLWLSRDNHMLIIKPEKISLVLLPSLEVLFSWVLSEVSPPSGSDDERHLQSRLRGRVQVNPHSPYYFGHEPMDPLLPLPELVVEQPGPNNYESIGVSSQIRLHPSAYRWANVQGNYVMGGAPTNQFRAFQGTHIPMPLFMLPPTVPYQSRPMASPPPEFEASVVNTGSNYVVPQEPMSNFYANGGISHPQAMGTMMPGPMPQLMSPMPQPMGPMPQPMGSMPQPMGSMPQPMGSMPQPMGPMPQPMGSMPQGAMPMPQGSASISSEGA